ncbi:peroxidase family protein [Pseudonocardia pini]|uniref:peroxidase family protein n=1 Tax=Pseudonocardia pini TaxID=2758030 RepID=UPI0015EFFE9A|nr:heme peroxidase family protein [Pseudonocardia pini]
MSEGQIPTTEGRISRVLTELTHGGHALVDDNAEALKQLDQPGSEEALSRVVQESVDRAREVGTTPFGYLFTSLQGTYPDAHLAGSTVAEAKATVDALNALGEAMIEQAEPAETNSTIPPIHTYWGQFVDHDITANTDRDTTVGITADPLLPLHPDQVVARLENLRAPSLNLDSVYGDGPFVTKRSANDEPVPYQADDPIKLKLGKIVTIPDFVPGDDDRDLPRRGTGSTDGEKRVAQIGDGRNDENLIVAQIHVAFLRFHNNAVNWVRANEPALESDVEVFLRARELTRWAYQWVTVHDYLRTITAPGIVDAVLSDDSDLLDLEGRGTYMPLEFSVAAFRFGHSMVRAAYDWNRFFGLPGGPQPAAATFDQMFRFTGGGGFVGPLVALPSNWPAEWDRMVEKGETVDRNRFARKIDTHLAMPLGELTKEGNDGDPTLPVNVMLKHLARRNLLRGFRLALPTGQAVARRLGATPLTEAELDGPGDLHQALVAGGFLQATPLWYYVLKEAEVQRGGESLGQVGSTIVAATLIGQLRADPSSYLQDTSWSPAEGVTLLSGAPIRSIADFLRFAGVLT